MTKMRHAYSPSEGGVFHPKGKSLTRQSMKDEVDVNNIVKRHYDVGSSFNLQEFTDEVLDTTGARSYHEALNTVLAAQDSFDKLPAELREAHQNDPLELLRWTESDEFTSGKADLFRKAVKADPEPPVRPDPAPDPAPDPKPAA